MRIFLTMLAIVILFVGIGAANPPEPNYGAGIVIDGSPGDWDLTEDFFANMYEAGNPEKDLLSKLYLRYDCYTQTLFGMVLAEDAQSVEIDPDNAFMKLGGSKLVDGNSGNDGTPPDFEWIPPVTVQSETVDGFEASAYVDPRNYSDFQAHIMIEADRTSTVENGAIPLYLKCQPNSVGLSTFEAKSTNELLPFALGGLMLIAAGVFIYRRKS